MEFSVSAQKISLSLVSHQKTPFSCTDCALRTISAQNFPLVQIFGSSEISVATKEKSSLSNKLKKVQDQR
jgi:hypothetical protein